MINTVYRYDVMTANVNVDYYCHFVYCIYPLYLCITYYFMYSVGHEVIGDMVVLDDCDLRSYLVTLRLSTL